MLIKTRIYRYKCNESYQIDKCTFNFYPILIQWPFYNEDVEKDHADGDIDYTNTAMTMKPEITARFQCHMSPNCSNFFHNCHGCFSPSNYKVQSKSFFNFQLKTKILKSHFKIIILFFFFWFPTVFPQSFQPEINHCLCRMGPRMGKALAQEILFKVQIPREHTQSSQVQTP